MEAGWSKIMNSVKKIYYKIEYFIVICLVRVLKGVIK